MNRIIVALIGHKRSGKDTAAFFFKKYFAFQKYAFADSVREVCKAFFGWSLDTFEDNKEEVDPIWGISKRQALQFMGTEVGRRLLPETFPSLKKVIGDEIWIKRFEQTFLQSTKNFVISDLRFENEFQSVKNLTSKSFFIGIHRPIIKTDLHESESYIDGLHQQCDFHVDNNSSIVDYFQKLHQVEREIAKIVGEEYCVCCE